MDYDFINFRFYVIGEKENILDLRTSKDYSVDRYKTSLLYSLIDQMAKSVYPKKGNKDRMLEFITQYCDWEDKDRISIPQLHEYLKINSSASLYEIRDVVSASLFNFSNFSPIPLTKDPKIDEIELLWPRSDDVEDIKNFRHLNLFYELRNSLVHELRTKGYAFKMFESDNPHYMHLTATVGTPGNITFSIDSFELCYPVLFFSKLIDSALQNLEYYYNQHPESSPLYSNSSGSLWITLKNKKISE